MFVCMNLFWNIRQGDLIETVKNNNTDISK